MERPATRVLIVDDIPETVEFLAKLLALEPDLEVAGTAGTGREAIAAVERLRPDVVLIDILMPDMDGLTATAALLERTPGLPVIVMSILGDADHRRRAMAAGAREFLVKPFSSDELFASVRHAGWPAGGHPGSHLATGGVPTAIDEASGLGPGDGGAARRKHPHSWVRRGHGDVTAIGAASPRCPAELADLA